MLKNIVLMILATLAMLCLSACSSTQPVAQMQKSAIKGYDTVSYFVSSKSNPGDAAYTYTYKNSEWSFQNQENMERFKAEPEKYIPLYNGFCAYEIAEGKRVESDPKIWHIYNKKLYLFSDEKARQLWFRDITKMIESSNAFWKSIMPVAAAPVIVSAAPSQLAKSVTAAAKPIKPEVQALKGETVVSPKPKKITAKTPVTTVIKLDEPVSVAAETAKAKSIVEMREVALEGYDPVAYFDSSESYMADGTYAYNYNKTEWFFKNSAHLEKFKANPQMYAPAFSGFCAYELAEGNLVAGNPRIWHIYNKRLYLFSSEEVKEQWYQDISTMIEASEKAWKRMTP